MGQRGVAHVILNRAKKSKTKPCVVLHAPGQFKIRFKKSYAGKAWDKAWQLANHPGLDPTGGALYFIHQRVTISWKARLTTIIGSHKFYK